MRILFLSRWYPDPPDNGSKIRVSNLLRGLCERHKMTLISFFDHGEGVSDREFSSPALTEAHVCPYREFDPHSGRALRGYLSRTPRYIVDTYRPEMEALIHRTIQKIRYDLVIASQLSMASYYRCFRGIPAIFEEAELGLYWPYEAPKSPPWSRMRRKLTWAKHRRFMARVLANFHLCTVVSEQERKLLAATVPAFRSIHVIPNSIDVDQCRSRSIDRIPDSLVFAGSLRYGPNHDAMMWFLREIYPAIRAEMPGVQLKITGDPGIRQPLPDSNAVLTGRIPDVHSVVAASTVSLAPIRIGGGTRVKIIESFAIGTPVVATRKAVEGLEVRDGEHLLIADTPHEFAQAVLHLLRGPERAREIAENALQLVRTHYDWRVTLQRFMNLVDQASCEKTGKRTKSYSPEIVGKELY
jgi:glycosyltransferase involved in cell wall biosynthesis